MNAEQRPVIFIVSDGRGDTCNQLLTAALVQFPGQECEIERRAAVLSREQVAAVVAEAHDRGATIFYTLVGQETRRAMADRAAELLVPTVDVLGPAFIALHDVFHSEPTATPGLYYASERARIDRQEAIDFTLKHDDGQRPHELGEADVIIVGVSRVSKSTTCFYLAYNGVKAANVPLVPNQEPLPGLLDVDPARVVGLRMNLTRLLAVREVRTRHLGRAGTAGYADKRQLAAELRAAHRQMEHYGWRSLDASYMAVEEIAREVMRLRGLPLRPLG